MVRISDDGVGLAAPVREEGGLATMRERAEEVGGRLACRPGEPRGLVVEAYLPVDDLTISPEGSPA